MENKFTTRNLVLTRLCIVIALAVGCSSTSEKGQSSASPPQKTASRPAKPGKSKSPALPAGITLHKDNDIQGVWLAPGFNFKGYDGLYISDTEYRAVERANEEKMQAMATRAVREQLAEA
jgi:hypothetical protein